MIRRRIACATFAVVLAGAATAQAASDHFDSNPLAGGSPWSFGLGDNSHNQFSWSPGELTVRVDTSLPTARLDLPLGTTLSDDASFLLAARFQFAVLGAPNDQFAQFAFGLTNQALTGGDRTGTLSNFDSANTYHTVEFNYYPNVSTLFGGPTLAPAVFGGPSGSAFNNFASVFGPAADLGDNVVGVTELPASTWLEAQLAYDGASKVLTLSMYAVQPDDSLTLLITGVTPIDLAAFDSSYDTFNPFVVDTLSIMTYHDAFTSPTAPSLVADVTFDSIRLVVVPEPASVLLAGIGAVALWMARRR